MSEKLGLTPVNNCVLVELGREHDKLGMQMREGKYDTRTNGIVIGLPVQVEGQDATKLLLGAGLIGKRIYFEEYKEGARIKRNGKLYAFIKIEDIRGFEDV